MRAVFGFGPWEIAIILVAVLAVAGPALIPRLAKRFGELILGFREAADQLSESVHKDLDSPEKSADTPRLAERSSSSEEKPAERDAATPSERSA